MPKLKSTRDTATILLCNSAGASDPRCSKKPKVLMFLYEHLCDGGAFQRCDDRSVIYFLHSSITDYPFCQKGASGLPIPAIVAIASRYLAFAAEIRNRISLAAQVEDFA